jgi:hypothetical protein
MLLSILKKKKTYLTIVSFGKWLCQFWRVCEVWVRVIVTTVTVVWGFTAIAVRNKSNSQQLYVFEMNNKASPLSVNISNKCSYFFPYFPGLQNSLAGK